MAQSVMMWLCALLFVFGVGKVSGGCVEDMQVCTDGMANVGQSGDLAVMCKKVNDAISCLKSIDTCTGNFKSALDAALKAAEPQTAQCKGTGEGGEMGSCEISKLQECVGGQEGKSEKEMCMMIKPAMKCAENFAKKCKSKALDEMFAQQKDAMDKSIKKCKEMGYSTDGNAGETIVPSFITVLAAAIVVAIRANF